MVLAFHKPKGLAVEQASQPTRGEGGRKRTLNDYLADLTAEHHPLGRLSAVGRLDKETTGLLLLTDDGHLSERVLRPGGLLKVYEATVKLRSPATCDAERLQRMCQGVELADGMARADSAEVVAEWQEEAPRCAHLSHGPRNAKRAAKAEAKAEAKAAKRRSQQQQQQPEQGRSEPSSAAASEATQLAALPGGSGGESGPAEAHATAAAVEEASAAAVEAGGAALPPFNVYVVRLGMRIGRNRVVRRLLGAVGLPCYELKRTRIGPLALGGDTSSAEAQAPNHAVEAAAVHEGAQPAAVQEAASAASHELVAFLGLEQPGMVCRLGDAQERALRAALAGCGDP